MKCLVCKSEMNLLCQGYEQYHLAEETYQCKCGQYLYDYSYGYTSHRIVRTFPSGAQAINDFMYSYNDSRESIDKQINEMKEYIKKFFHKPKRKVG